MTSVLGLIILFKMIFKETRAMIKKKNKKKTSSLIHVCFQKNQRFDFVLLKIIQMSSMHHQLSPSCVLPAFEAARDLTVHHDKTSSGENSGMSDIYALFFLCCAGGKIPEGFFHVVALQSKCLLNLWLPISEFGQPAYAVGMIL